MTSQETVDLIQKAAANLSGKVVIVRFRPPVLAGAHGMALVDRATKRAYIDIIPGLGEAALLRCLTHEAAHHRRGDPVPGNWVSEKPGAIRSPAVLAHVSAMPREAEADRMATDWLDYAEQNYKRYGDPTWPILDRKLAALGAWLEPKLKEMIDQAARLAVAKTLILREGRTE